MRFGTDDELGTDEMCTYGLVNQRLVKPIEYNSENSMIRVQCFE